MFQTLLDLFFAVFGQESGSSGAESPDLGPAIDPNG